MKKSRRSFIKSTTLATLSFGISSPTFSLFPPLSSKIVLGVISDLHHDLIPDGVTRLQEFLKEADHIKPQAIIQMGDFAFTSTRNQHLVNLFNEAHSKAFHLIGNHDMDGGFTKKNCLDAWKIPHYFYSKEVMGIKLIFLDGNEEGSPTHKSGYASYIGPRQQDWLKAELANSKIPVVIFSHQPIAGIYPIDNTIEIQTILSDYSQKILLALNGHSHVTQHLQIGGVNYVHINSASYYWVGAKFKHQSYSSPIHDQYPSLSSTCPYEHSLFAFITIDPENMQITIEGQKTNWIGPNPTQLGYDIVNAQELKNYVKPENENRKLSITAYKIK